jgi:NitT/TauT family transport system substrate-binding protein
MPSGSVAPVGALLLTMWVLVASGTCAPPASPTAPAGILGTKIPQAGSASTSASSAPVASAPASPAPLDVLKLGDGRVFTAAPLYIGLEKGYFREQGIDLRLEPVVANADVVPFLATGDLDLNQGGYSVGSFNAFERGADIWIVAPASIQPLHDSASPLVVRKELMDSGVVRTPADLRGRRVAVNSRGAGIEYQLTIALDRAGVTLQDIDEVTVPFADMPLALSNGSIDAALVAEPFATRAVNLGAASKLVKDTIPGEMTTVIMASGKLVRERPDVLRRWMVAYLRATRDIQPPQFGVPDPARLYSAEHLAILQQYINAPEQVLRDQVPPTWDPDLEIQTDNIMQQQLVHMRNGVLALPQPIPVERMVDDSFVRYTLDRLGRVRQ